MMNVNAKIDWQAGMELTAKTFIELDERIARNQQITHRIANGNQFGIIPATPFCCDGRFVKKTLEIEQLSLMAMMPSGRILHVDERVVVDIPILYGNEYYLGCGLSERMKTFDKEMVPFIRPEADFGIYTLEELESRDLLPLMKFQVKEGIFSIDSHYIPPFLILNSDNRFETYKQTFIEKIRVLAEHPNLESGEGKRGLMHYVFLLKKYSTQNRVLSFIELLQEIVQAVDFYIVSPNTEKPVELLNCSVYDVAVWFKWLEEFLHGAATILDGVVLEDHSINFDELKAQIKEELYQQLYLELREQLYKDLHADLHKEIMDELYQSLSEYINGNFKREIYALLEGELSEQLYDKLYKTLYEMLFNALYVPPVEEKDEFMPLI